MDLFWNFTNVCHHGKEEGSLFPALEKSGMRREGGPIARMLFEHEITKKLAEKMEVSATQYLQTGRSEELVADIRAYASHVSQHLTKENFRLFMMADMMLKSKSDMMTQELAEAELAKLSSLGKTRDFYEKLVESYDTDIRKQGL